MGFLVPVYQLFALFAKIFALEVLIGRKIKDWWQN
jgi:hypothetical protein